MFKSIFSFGRRSNRMVTDALYNEIVASARQPVFYDHMGVQDIPLGRYEMLSTHMFLFLERTRGGSEALIQLAQDVTEEFFKDVDHSLRELGIGDQGVPKRMKKLARMFYGRAEAYREAVAVGDDKALAAALARNICPQDASWAHADEMAAYVNRALAHLATQDDTALLAGTISFPDAAQTEAER